jgi:hypothetical protein
VQVRAAPKSKEHAACLRFFITALAMCVQAVEHMLLKEEKRFGQEWMVQKHLGSATRGAVCQP